MQHANQLSAIRMHSRGMQQDLQNRVAWPSPTIDMDRWMPTIDMLQITIEFAKSLHFFAMCDIRFKRKGGEWKNITLRNIKK